MGKRLVDILFSVAGLLVLGLPMLLLASWIKLDSSGPALFRQVRVGRHGRPFEILKFRTMLSARAADDLQLTVGRDPRITGAGAFLRRYKLDELPQLLNVLGGSMSFVGPRPEVPRYVEHYPPEVRDLVLSVRPGITDLASIAFRDENEILGRHADPERAYVEEVLPIKLRYYLEYVRGRSMALDAKIAFGTVMAVFFRGRR